MSKESDAVRREIAALEAELNERQPSAKKARKSTVKDDLLSELRALEAKVKEACGESFMDDDSEMYMDDEESAMGYMDGDDEDFMDDDLIDEPVVLEEDIDVDFDDDLDDDFDDFDDEPIDLEDEEDVFMLASEEDPDIEDEINQDSLDDVLEEEKDPASIVTDMSMLDTAPTGYVARLKSASARLDKVADYLEKQGNKKLALRVDKIADAIDARIQQEANNA